MSKVVVLSFFSYIYRKSQREIEYIRQWRLRSHSINKRIPYMSIRHGPQPAFVISIQNGKHISKPKNDY